MFGLGFVISTLVVPAGVSHQAAGFFRRSETVLGQVPPAKKPRLTALNEFGTEL